MIRKFSLVTVAFLLTKCQAQPNASSETFAVRCNQQVYGSKKYIKQLPAYICIPDGYVIDDHIRWADLDNDSQNDFLAVKYNKKEDDQMDGDLTYWNFYTRKAPDTLYRLHHELTNIVPPFIKDYALEYVSTHPKADSIFSSYPRRVSHNLAFVLSKDTLRLSYKFDDSYGKTFVFVYDQARNNWFLENVQYFIGELPAYWWRDEDFYYPLNDQLKTIEEREVKQNVAIENFDLREAFRYRQREWEHLSQHIDEVDEKQAKSISALNFPTCKQLILPVNWVY